MKEIILISSGGKIYSKVEKIILYSLNHVLKVKDLQYLLITQRIFKYKTANL